MATRTGGPKLTKAQAKRCRAHRRTIDDELPRLIEYLEPRRPDLDAELAELCQPRWRTPGPTAAELADGVYFDLYEVDRFLRFAANVRHIKGRRYAGRPVILDLWQVVYIVAPLFGWRNADGTRYYRELFLEVPRKNGKSTLAAVIALFLLFADREPGAEVVSAAYDKDQARAVFAVAAAMAKRSPALRHRARIIDRKDHELIEVLRNPGSSYKIIAGVSDKGGKGKHGLNLHGAIIDELHVIDDEEYLGTLETSTGSRDQPLVIYITTAGDPDGSSPCWQDRRDSVIREVDGVTRVRQRLGVIFAADPKVATNGRWRDPKTWAQANPSLGGALTLRYLEGMVTKAEQSPAERARFLRLHLNVPTSLVSSWHPLPVWDATAGIVDPLELVGRRCYGGLDLASSTDLAALVLIFPDDANESLDVLARFWTPEATLVERAERDRADYVRWVEEGRLIATPGEVIDFDFIEDEVTKLLAGYDLRALNYDPWGSKQLASHLTDAGAPLWLMPQTYARISPALKELDRLIVARRFRHGGHPVLRYCASGVKVSEDTNGNLKPNRKLSRSRIDGIAGAIMAIEAWLRDETPGRSVYEERGVEVV